MKRTLTSIVVLAAFLAGLAPAPSFGQAQPAAKEKLVGRALYDKLRKEGRSLVKFDGLMGLSWTPDGKAYYIPEDNTLKRVDIATGEKSPLFDDAKILAALNAMTGRQETRLPFVPEGRGPAGMGPGFRGPGGFQFLDDGKRIQFSAWNKVFLYELATGRLNAFEPERTVTGVRGRGYGDVLSPDLKLRAFTRSFNLYVKDMDGNETALTTDGTEDLRNGFPDWVYPEELGQYQAFWWSPDSKRIAFMRSRIAYAHRCGGRTALAGVRRHH